MKMKSRDAGRKTRCDLSPCRRKRIGVTFLLRALPTTTFAVSVSFYHEEPGLCDLFFAFGPRRYPAFAVPCGSLETAAGGQGSGGSGRVCPGGHGRSGGSPFLGVRPGRAGRLVLRGVPAHGHHRSMGGCSRRAFGERVLRFRKVPALR